MRVNAHLGPCFSASRLPPHRHCPRGLLSTPMLARLLPRQLVMWQSPVLEARPILVSCSASSIDRNQTLACLPGHYPLPRSPSSNRDHPLRAFLSNKQPGRFTLEDLSCPSQVSARSIMRGLGRSSLQKHTSENRASKTIFEVIYCRYVKLKRAESRSRTSR